jgi:hypothetical protein
VAKANGKSLMPKAMIAILKIKNKSQRSDHAERQQFNMSYLQEHIYPSSVRSIQETKIFFVNAVKLFNGFDLNKLVAEQDGCEQNHVQADEHNTGVVYAVSLSDDESSSRSHLIF